MELSTRSTVSALAVSLVSVAARAGDAQVAQASPAGPTAAAASRNADAWDVTLPRGRTREIDFTTSEGTWMSSDLSPDGRWIVFDLLGHVYRMPAGGGTAEALTQGSGVALNFHPRFSPDGARIAFISDRSGQLNLWVMDADGANQRTVFRDAEICVVEPAWAPDGRSIVVRRQRTCHRGSGASAGLWQYPLDGGAPTELVSTAASPTPGWPSFAPDGKSLYFHYGICPAYHTGRNDVMRGCMQVRQLDLATRTTTDVTSGETWTSQWARSSNGSAIAPQPSPDGRWLAFARRIPDGTISFKGHVFGPRTALWLRDLRTGAERIVMDPIESDLTQGLPYAMHLLPTYAWSKDGRTIVIAQGGKLRRLEVETGRVETIPFTARVRRTISEMAYVSRRLSDGPVEPRFLRWASPSPSARRQVVFEAVGKLWLSAGPGAAPRRLLTGIPAATLELTPAWSPDGRSIAFTTWDGAERGHVWIVATSGCAAAGCTPRRLTTEPGEYLNPAWAPDGKWLVVTRGSGATARGHPWSSNIWYELVRIPAACAATPSSGAGCAPAPLARVADDQLGALPRASVGTDGRVYYVERGTESTTGREATRQLLKSVAADGSSPRTHASFAWAEEVAPSPDRRWLAFAEGDHVYLAPFPDSMRRVDTGDSAGGVRRLSAVGGLFPRWLDAGTLSFASGRRVFTHRLSTGITDSAEMRLSIPRPLPAGTIALTGARILTMEGRRVIDSGTIVVARGRIACVGRCSARGADRVIDARGKTIMPGMIDLHSHHHTLHRGVVPLRNYESAIYLAYGVTTTLDPASWSQDVYPEAEAIEAGTAIGPRTFTTGDVFHTGNGSHHNDLTGPEVAEVEVARRADWGAVSLKNFLVAGRDQQQWMLEAARKRGIIVTGEGASLEHDLAMVMDGQAGWEHDITHVPIYSDVAKFFGQARATYSITLVTDGPGPLNEEYWWQSSDVWKDEKQRAWLPWWWLVSQQRVRWLRPTTDYTYPILSQGLADIIAEGGYGAIGGHGDQHGLGSHWEVWMMASAMGPMGALEVATAHGAHALGLERDLGSIAVGKVADLLVLDGNPLDDIRRTGDLRYVMKGGVLYDARTVDQLWPAAQPFGPHYWVMPDAWRSDTRPTDYWDRAKQP